MILALNIFIGYVLVVTPLYIPSGFLDENIKLQNVDLTSNDLESLPETLFQPLSRLKKLNLSRNRFPGLPNHIGPDLTHLNLSTNNITSLPDGCFQKLTKLQEVDMSNNSFEIIPENIFANNAHLQYIIWENDKLDLAGGARKLPKLLFEKNKMLESFSYSVQSKNGSLSSGNVFIPSTLFKQQVSSLKHLKISNTLLNWTALGKSSMTF